MYIFDKKKKKRTINVKRKYSILYSLFRVYMSFLRRVRWNVSVRYLKRSMFSVIDLCCVTFLRTRDFNACIAIKFWIFQEDEMRVHISYRTFIKFILGKKKKKNGTNFLLIVKNKIRVRTKDFSQIKLKIFITFPYITSTVEHIFLYRYLDDSYICSKHKIFSLLHILLISISYLITIKYTLDIHIFLQKNLQEKKTTYIRQNFWDILKFIILRTIQDNIIHMYT